MSCPPPEPPLPLVPAAVPEVEDPGGGGGGGWCPEALDGPEPMEEEEKKPARPEVLGSWNRHTKRRNKKIIYVLLTARPCWEIFLSFRLSFVKIEMFNA